MIEAERQFAVLGFKASTAAMPEYIAALRNSASMFAKRDDATSAELSEILRQFAQELDRNIETFHRNLDRLT